MAILNEIASLATSSKKMKKSTSYSEKKKRASSQSSKAMALKSDVKNKKSTRVPEDSDSESDYDNEEDDAACKSYMDDIGFDKEYGVAEAAADDEAADDDAAKEEAEMERIKQERLASRKRKKMAIENTSSEDRTLCVDNVNVKTQKKVLIRFFKNYGQVQTVRFRNIPIVDNKAFKMKQIMKQQFNDKRNSMTAYIKFVDSKSCEAAQEGHLSVVDGHHLLVRRSVGRQSAEVKKDLSKGCTILVGKLPKDAEEELLYERFSPCGCITDITLLRKEGVCSGVAFVTFKAQDAVTAALQLSGEKMRVTKAVRKVKKSKQGVSGSGKSGFSKHHKNAPVPKQSKKEKKKTVKKLNKLPSIKDAVQSSSSKTADTNIKTVVPSAKTNETFSGQKFDQTKKAKKRKRRDKSEVRKRILAKKLASCAPKTKQ